MKKSIIILIIFILGITLGIFITDDTFGRAKRQHYIAWSYDYFDKGDGFKRCLYIWKGNTGNKLFCLNKLYER